MSDVVKETLELASTRDILDELDKRHSSTVFVGKPLGEEGVVCEHSSGGDSMCMGMTLRVLAALLLRSLKDDRSKESKES